MPIDDYSPISTGDTLQPLSVQFSYKDGTPVPLSGATLALVMTLSIGTRKVGTGSWVIDDAANGKAHYTYSAADVNTPGQWSLQAAITIGGATQHFDIKVLEIDPPL